MSDFFQALTAPDFPLLRYALAAGLLSSVALGIIGAFVVARRVTALAGAISHCVLAGIGLGLFMSRRLGIAWADPMQGAVVAALASAVLIGVVSLRGRQREDTVIGMVWAVGMAIGLILIHLTPGYTDPMSYLFGNILYISRADLGMILVLNVVVIVPAIVFYNPLLAICFDEEFPRVRGLRVEAYYLLLLCLTALTVVLMVKLVGIVLVIALLTLPAAAAGHFARRLWQMMALAVVFCAVFITAGLALSYRLDLPSGPVIVLLAGAAYLLIVLARRLIRP